MFTLHDQLFEKIEAHLQSTVPHNVIEVLLGILIFAVFTYLDLMLIPL